MYIYRIMHVKCTEYKLTGKKQGNCRHHILLLVLLLGQSLSIRHTGLACARPIIGKHDVIHETGRTQDIALLSEEDQVMATVNM